MNDSKIMKRLSDAARFYLRSGSKQISQGLSESINDEDFAATLIESFIAWELAQMEIFGATVITGTNKYLMSDERKLVFGDEAHALYYNRFKEKIRSSAKIITESLDEGEIN